MNLGKYYRTISHLKFIQLRYQVWYRFRKFWRGKTGFKYSFSQYRKGCPLDIERCIFKYKSYIDCTNTFSFLNIEDSFSGWNDNKKGMLWAYNLNYMDYLLQEDMSFEQGRQWINKFIDELTDNKIGMDPYPIALRGINWIKFISYHAHEISEEEKKKWDASLYAQYSILKDNLEYHLLGNHLLEDAYSLFIGGIYFEDKKLFDFSSDLLRKELNEQILFDGAHYEQSPMYHCILLERLLDCINIGQNIVFDTQEPFVETLKANAVKMLGHLENITWNDMSVPLLNDSANGIAPSVNDIFSYAKRLKLNWTAIPMNECGYRKYHNDIFEAIIDVGNITASYQCGHSHADTFNYELRINGRPFIVDTGISTYEKNSRRQYERGSSAHNTVMINSENTSDVWGGFRIGERADVIITDENEDTVYAQHNGYYNRYKINIGRRFILKEALFTVEDRILGEYHAEAKSVIILDPSVRIVSFSEKEIITDVAQIKICGCSIICVQKCLISKSYNSFLETNKIVFSFKNNMSYKIFKI